MDINKNYPNDDIVVHWKSGLCQHSGNCVRALSAVFNPKRRPWIVMEASDTDSIIAAVLRCPSGALSYSLRPKTAAEASE